MSGLLTRALRLLRKPPTYILRRVIAESRAELDRFTQPARSRSFTVARLLEKTDDASLAALWDRLATQPWPVAAHRLAPGALEQVSPGASAELLRRAAAACRHEVDLLGSGPTPLGNTISWDTDFKTGDRWASVYFRDIQVVDRTRPSDVKVPWELSRLQWLLPVGQAFLLTGDDRYAECAREIFEQWIAANPVGANVNWAIAMEPALRILTWSWLLRVFAQTRSWSDPTFRGRFLCCLYLHGDFVARYIERADLNGNHFTADCVGLVVAGALFGGKPGRAWLESGWTDLQREIDVQLLADGVDFEASAAYHRLVGELFMFGGIFAEHSGLRVPFEYKQRLVAAARFTVAYTRPDGSAPLWGDADDARALPFGTAPLDDHRHFIACMATWLDDAVLRQATQHGWDEALWLFGRADIPEKQPPQPPSSAAFPDAGVYVLRTAMDHVFIDCGEVGLHGRGGHGHNDILSFDAVLGGVPIVSDSGCFVYTASFEERNRFRATRAHNTPQIDDEEVNRFVSPDLLWLLQADAHPLGASIRESETELVFQGGHSGFERLADPVKVMRTLALHRHDGRLRVTDCFEGNGVHRVSIPVQFAPGWSLSSLSTGTAYLTHAQGHGVLVRWQPGPWQVSAVDGVVAPTYGVQRAAPSLLWTGRGPIRELSLTVDFEFRPQGTVQ